MIRRTGFLSALALLVWMSSIYAATPLETTLLPTSTYAPDTYVLPIIDVPAGYTIAMIKVDREEWLDTNTSIVASLEVSTDGFVTSTALGSPHIQRPSTRARPAPRGIPSVESCVSPLRG